MRSIHFSEIVGGWVGGWVWGGRKQNCLEIGLANKGIICTCTTGGSGGRGRGVVVVWRWADSHG